MKVKVSQATRMITACIKAGLVAMLAGSPGIGKSHIAYQIAKKYNLKVIDVRLSQADPTDLLGFPSIQGKKAGYVPMETFPIEGDKLPVDLNEKGEIIHTYDGWLLFLDEFTSAAIAVQAAAYKIVLDRMVGVHKLHKNVAIMCAGNLETDGAIVNPMSTALQSRLVHMELIVDVQEWTDWAAESKLNHRINDFINFKPGNLYTFKPDHTDNTYACPRTWEFADRILKATPDDSPDLIPLLAGTISEGVAHEFVTFTKIYKELPKISDIIKTPEDIRVPDEPSILFALTGSMSHHASSDNMTPLMKYIDRIPTEFQVVCLRDTIRRNKGMLAHAALRNWVAKNGDKLY